MKQILTRMLTLLLAAQVPGLALAHSGDHGGHGFAHWAFSPTHFLLVWIVAGLWVASRARSRWPVRSAGLLASGAGAWLLFAM